MTEVWIDNHNRHTLINHTVLATTKFVHSIPNILLPAAMFLLDANYEVYVWLGWWPEERNKLLKEANATTGSAHARWLRDKKLALQTALNYIKGIYM